MTINSTLPDDAMPSLAKLDTTLAAVNGPATPMTAPVPVDAPVSRPSSPSLATRRTGRFMDVVHPSADMKTANKMPSRPSRQGVNIAPAEQLPAQKPVSQPSIQPVVEAVAPIVDKDEMMADIPTSAAPSERDTAMNEWPDPIEMSGYEPEPVTTAEPSVVSKEAVAEPSVDSKEVVADPPQAVAEEIAMPTYEDPQPLMSPFITDAKVEKRPLGGTPVEEPGHAPVLGVLAKDDEALGTVADPADQLPATPPATETPLPPELQSDLMAIEAAGEMPVVASSPAPQVTPVSGATQAVTQPASQPTAESGPTSIPQQYHEAPSTGDEPNGSIYDTASYHQPLAHPAKAKPGWLWIVWILLLLIVGGGGAAALYFLGII